MRKEASIADSVFIQLTSGLSSSVPEEEENARVTAEPPGSVELCLTWRDS